MMKQDAMDDKIKERCKTCEKQCVQEDLNKLRSCQSSYRAKANLDGSKICQASIEQIESFSMDRESVEKLSRQSPENSIDQDCDNFYREKEKKGLDRQPSCREVSRSYQDVQKQFFKEEKNTNMNAIKHAIQPMIQTTF